MMTTHIARICWNSDNWTCPTGDAKKIEHKKNYVVKHGFGHEEWLFNLAWLIDGYHYSHLQPVDKPFEKRKGTTINVLLYSIPPPGTPRLYIGRIHKCEVLTHEQAHTALSVYRSNKWFEEMAEQVSQVGGRKRSLLDVKKAFWVFNIRFKPDDLEIFDPYRLVGDHDQAHSFSRYNLVEASEVENTQLIRRRRSTSLKSTAGKSRKGTEPTLAKQTHNIIQNELYQLLCRKVGKKNVVMEEDYVDLKLNTNKGPVFIEIKSDPRPRSAIREALGQLLDYALYDVSKETRIPELLVVGQGQSTPEVEEYLRTLRKLFKIPIRYRSFVRGQSSFEVEGIIS